MNPDYVPRRSADGVQPNAAHAVPTRWETHQRQAGGLAGVALILGGKLLLFKKTPA